MNQHRKNFVSLLLLISVFLSAFSSGFAEAGTPKPAETEKVNLFVYSGAGLKKAMEAIKTAFELEENVAIEYSYAGSAQLLGQISTSGKGDVLIVGSQDAYKTAVDKKWAQEPQLVAYHTPIIAVPKGNPAKIHGLQDFTRAGVRVVLGDPEANAIGKTAQKIFAKNKIEGVDKNVVSLTATVNEIFVILKAGNADAGIVTKDGAFGQTDAIDLVEIPADENIDQIIPIGVLTHSEHPEMAQKFVDFVASKEGKAIFEKFGFAPFNE